MRLALVAFVVLLAGCIQRVPPQRLAQRAQVAVLYVVDPSHSGTTTSAPEGLKAAVAKTLEAHNLEAVPVALEALKGAKVTDARLTAVRGASEAPWLLVVELRAQFFSQLDGRYRWEVGTNLTVEQRGGTPLHDAFEVPVVLMFDHEKQAAAISSAANDIATRLGVLLDGVLASAPATAPSTQSK